MKSMAANKESLKINFYLYVFFVIKAVTTFMFWHEIKELFIKQHRLCCTRKQPVSVVKSSNETTIFTWNNLEQSFEGDFRSGFFYQDNTK